MLPFLRRAAAGLALLLATAATAAGPGGALTHGETNQDAFARPGPGIDAAQLRRFNFGNRIFNTRWTTAPGSAVAFDGLGPTFNRESCSACHLRDGRGRPPLAGETQLSSALVRWSLPGSDAHGAPLAVPGYGTQLNDRAVAGVAAEAKVTVEWSESEHRYGDGTPYRLRRPQLRFSEAAYGALPATLLTSLRVAPALIGLGLLEAVPEAQLLALTDADDADGDGISGRMNFVYDEASSKKLAGRFGWKANATDLRTQNADAALGDIGLTSTLRVQANCPAAQTACAAAPDGGKPELSDEFLDRLTEYVQLLGVADRRDAQAADVQRGEAVFARLRCGACHVPQLRTGTAAIAALSQQTIAPYTDLLLHDLGDGLADGRPDHLASASEWRTPPLWGLGLVPTVNGHSFYLHDGRARDLAEAILWHGGEAQAAREGFRLSGADDRAALLAFLRSL